MLVHGRRDWSRYGFALLTVGIVLAAKLVLDATFLNTADSPFLLVFGAVMASAWYGGRGPGLLATLLLVPIIDPSFLVPSHVFSRDSAEEILKLFLFVAEGALISVLGGVLHDAEARKSAILATATDAIISVDHTGRIIEFNPAAEAIFGHSRADAIGANVAELLIPERYRAAHREGMRTYLATGSSARIGRRIEVVALRNDGSEFPAELLITPMVTDHLPHFTGFLRDITERKEAEESLRATNERFRILAESVPCVIWIAASNGRVLYVNAQSHAYTGLQEAAEHTWPAAVLHPDDRNGWDLQWNKSIRDGDTFEFECRLRRHDGVYRWFLNRAAPLKNTNGGTSAWFGTATDIDSRKRSEQAQHFLAEASAVLSELQDTDFSALHRIIRIAVPTFADWCSVHVQSDDGSLECLAANTELPLQTPSLLNSLFSKFPPKSTDSHGAFRALRTGMPELMSEISEAWLTSTLDDPDHQRMVREAGLRSYICVPLRTMQGPFGVLTFALAESGRCYDEADLLIAKELAQRAAAAMENATLMRTLHDADRRKDEFLANVSHELRTPMSSILGMLQLSLVEPLNATLRDYLETAKESAENLLFLLDDILDFSRIKVGGFQIDNAPFRLRDSLDGMMRMLVMRARDKNLELTWSVDDDVPNALVGDSRRLRQILANLVNNAIKFTDKGQVTLTTALEVPADAHAPTIVQVAEECDNGSQEPVVASVSDIQDQVTLRFVVSDTGIGIPREHQEHVFGAFTQLDASTTRIYPGIGLGLAICRELISQMGGRIWIESEPGSGSRFFVSVPFQIAAMDPDSHATHSWQMQKTDRPLHVLLAEDTAANQKVIQGILVKRGHTVEIANNGIEAVASFKQRCFDVVLMDVQMPLLDGMQATIEMRRMQAGPTRTPIIGISAHSASVDQHRFLNAGMDACLLKPIDAAKLITIIEQPGFTGSSITSESEALGDKLKEEPDKAQFDAPLCTISQRPMVDRKAVLQRMGGDRQLFQTMLQFVVEDTPKLMKSLHEAIEIEPADFGRAVHSAHSLQGLVANFSDEVAAIAGQVVAAARAENVQAAKDLLAALDRQTAALSELLARGDDSAD